MGCTVACSVRGAASHRARPRSAPSCSVPRPAKSQQLEQGCDLQPDLRMKLHSIAIQRVATAPSGRARPLEHRVEIRIAAASPGPCQPTDQPAGLEGTRGLGVLDLACSCSCHVHLRVVEPDDVVRLQRTESQPATKTAALRHVPLHRPFAFDLGEL